MTKVIQIENVEAGKIFDCFKCLEAQIQSIKENFLPKEPTEYLSRKEVSDLFGVSLVTVNDWTQKNILQAYRIGNRVYYKRHEIEAALQEIKARK